MMARFQKIALSFSILIGFMAPSAWAVGVDLVGAGTYSMFTSNAFTPSSAFGYPGGGLVFNFRLGSKVDLSLGGLYLTSISSVSGVNMTNKMVNGQLALRLKFTRSIFIDVGGYYNYLMSSDQSFTGNDYGVLGGLGIIIPLGQSVGFLIHPQYQYALANIVNGPVTVTQSQVVGMVGFTFGMGGK